MRLCLYHNKKVYLEGNSWLPKSAHRETLFQLPNNSISCVVCRLCIKTVDMLTSQYSCKLLFSLSFCYAKQKHIDQLCGHQSKHNETPAVSFLLPSRFKPQPAKEIGFVFTRCVIKQK